MTLAVATPVRGRNRLDRFQVGCTFCGHLAGCQTMAEAFYHAQQAHRQHASLDEAVTVCDIMAHHGDRWLWTWDGTLLERKP